MVHQYKNNGYNIVLDVNSGSVHVVDDLVYDIIALYETNSKEEKLIPRRTFGRHIRKSKNLSKPSAFLLRIFIRIIFLILKSGRQWSKLYVCILPTTVIWPVNIVLPKRASIMGAGR